MAVIAPLSLLGKLQKPSSSLVDFRFTFKNSCYVQIYPHVNETAQLLIGAFIAFLARYFYICDERQVGPMSQVTLKIDSYQDGDEVISTIYDTILETLEPFERGAIKGLMPLGAPEMVVREVGKQSDVLATYTLYVTNSKGRIGSIFHMSAGADIICLPLTVGMMYKAIVSKLSESDIVRLHKCIKDLTVTHGTNHPRSLRALTDVPSQVLELNHVDWSLAASTV